MYKNLCYTFEKNKYLFFIKS